MKMWRCEHLVQLICVSVYLRPCCGPSPCHLYQGVYPPARRYQATVESLYKVYVVIYSCVEIDSTSLSAGFTMINRPSG